MSGHNAPSGHSASEQSTPPSTSTPVTQPVAKPVEQPAEELEGEELFQPFKGIEENLSQVRTVGPGPSRYTGTPSGIQLHTPTLGPGASLEELQ